MFSNSSSEFPLPHSTCMIQEEHMTGPYWPKPVISCWPSGSQNHLEVWLNHRLLDLTSQSIWFTIIYISIILFRWCSFYWGGACTISCSVLLQWLRSLLWEERLKFTQMHHFPGNGYQVRHALGTSFLGLSEGLLHCDWRRPFTHLQTFGFIYSWKPSVTSRNPVLELP